MASWIWSIGPWQGGQAGELLSTSARTLKIKLLEPSEASFTCYGFSADAEQIEELISDLWVYRNGTPIFRGRVTGPVQDNIAPDRYDITVEARDYRELLNRRILYADRTWTSIEQSTIAWNLIFDTQSLAGGDLTLAQGTWPTTGIVRPSVTFKAGDTVGGSLKVLSQMDGGFDWDIDMSLNVNLYYPSRGQDNGTVLDYGGVVQTMQRSFDPAQYANAVRQSGADTITPATVNASDLPSRVEGRWDAQFSDTQLTTADMVAKTANTNLALAQRALPAYQLQLAKGAWQGPSHVWVGDYVRVAVKAGRLNEVVTARVFEIDVNIDASNQEDVTIVVGNPVLDPRSILKGIGRRLAQLAKR
jgi:hypothetical protein